LLLIGSIYVRSSSSDRSVTADAAAVGLPFGHLGWKGLLRLCTPTETMAAATLAGWTIPRQFAFPTAQVLLLFGFRWHVIGEAARPSC